MFISVTEMVLQTEAYYLKHSSATSQLFYCLCFNYSGSFRIYNFPK